MRRVCNLAPTTTDLSTQSHTNLRSREPMHYPNIVHALERGRAPFSLPRDASIQETVSYDVIVSPLTPLRIGQCVQIRALRWVRSTDGEREDWTRYESIPTGVEGRIVGIRTMELATTELIVLNEVDHSEVKHAYLTVQHIEGKTIVLEIWRRILRTLLLPVLPHTRHVPLEKRVTITLAEE